MPLGLPTLPRVGHNIDWCIRLYGQSKILFRRVYSVCKNIHYVQDFRNFISRLIRKLLGTAHYLLYRGRLRRNSTVIIFFLCPPLKTSKMFKAPPPNTQNKNINFGSPPPSSSLSLFRPCSHDPGINNFPVTSRHVV
jgi:hypothetical protein